MSEVIATLGTKQAMLLDLLTDEQLQSNLEGAKANGNNELANAISEHLDAKAKAKHEAEVLESFTNALNALELPLEVPEGVFNIFRARVRDSRKLNKKEWRELKSTMPTITDEELGSRRVELDNFVWGAWTINKALSQPKASSPTTTRTRKLAVTVYSREGTNLTNIGNFRTSTEACEHLGFTHKGDSARRVLEAHKLVVDDYEGESFLLPPK